MYVGDDFVVFAGAEEFLGRDGVESVLFVGASRHGAETRRFALEVGELEGEVEEGASKVRCAADDQAGEMFDLLYQMESNSVGRPRDTDWQKLTTMNTSAYLGFAHSTVLNAFYFTFPSSSHPLLLYIPNLRHHCCHSRWRVGGSVSQLRKYLYKIVSTLHWSSLLLSSQD